MRPPKRPLLIPLSVSMRLIADGTWLLLPSQHYILLALSPAQQASPLQEAALHRVCADAVLVLEHQTNPGSLSWESGRAGFGPGQVMLGAGALGGPVGEGLTQVLQGSLLQGIRPESENWATRSATCPPGRSPSVRGWSHPCVPPPAISWAQGSQQEVGA